MPGTVLTVASGKGGVGKTTTAVNLAVALWREGNAVALVDADLGMANLAAVLGLEPTVTLHDVLAGRASLEEAVVEARGGDLVVLPGERDLSGFASADPGELRAVLAEVADGRDYVVVDTGAGVSYEDVLPLGLADEVLLVTTPEPAAIGDARKTLELSGLLDGAVLGVVVTRAREDTDAGAVAAEIGVELLGTIPEDPAVRESSMGGGPLESSAPDSPATAAYRELASAVDSAATAKTGGPATAAEATAPEPAAETAGAAVDAPGSGARGDEESGNAPPADAAEGDAAGTTESGEDAPAAPPAGDEEPADEEADGEEAPAAPPSAEEEPADEDADGDEGAEGSGEGETRVGGEATNEDDSSTGESDGTGEEEADGEVEDADGEAEDADGDAGAAEEGDSDVEADQQRRGGFLGWLGRRFS